MIVQCDNCLSRFNLDESLVKETGSKARCSVCQNVFTVYPPKPPPEEEPSEGYQDLQEELEETVALDSFPPAGENEMESDLDDIGAGLDEAFEEAVAGETMVTASPGWIPDEEEEALPEVELGPVAGYEDAGREVPPEGEDAEETTAPRKRSGLRVLAAVAVVLVLLVGAAVAVFLLAPEFLPDSLSALKPASKQEVTDIGVSRLSFKEVNGFFVDSDQRGQLFVVKGQVANNYPQQRSFILIKGSILNDRGEVVDKKLIYAANTFTDEEMKSMSAADMDTAFKNRFGKARMNFNIEPGTVVPFMIVFSDLPDNLSEFTVEAVSSSAGE